MGVELGATEDGRGLEDGVAVTVTVEGTAGAPGAVTTDFTVWMTVSGAAELEGSPPTFTTSYSGVRRVRSSWFAKGAA